MVGILGLAALLVALAVGVLVVVRRPAAADRPLRWAGLALTALVAVILTPYTVEDSGAAAAYLLGVPVVGAAIPVLADLRNTAVTLADAIGAAVVTGWGLLLALGIGMLFLPGAFLLFAALLVRVAARRSR
jgi:hypothetical protein